MSAGRAGRVMATQWWMCVLLLVQVNLPAVFMDSIEAIPPIAGSWNKPLNITCNPTITSADELVRLKMQIPGGVPKLILTMTKSGSSYEGTLVEPDQYSFVKVGDYGFTVTNLQAEYEDAKTYECSLVNKYLTEVTTVVIIGKPAVMADGQIQAGQRTTMRCDVRYEAPLSMDPITDSDKFPQLSASIGGVDQTGGTLLREDSSLKLTWNTTLGAADDKKDVVCKTYTINPSFEYNATLALNVLSEVANIQVGPQKDTYYVGEEINCTADGNPTPEYEWTPVETKSGLNTGPSLLVTDRMVGEPAETWTCKATNAAPIGKTIDTTITFSVLRPTDPPSNEVKEPPTAAIVAGVTVPLVLLIAAVAAIVAVFMRKKKSKKDEKTTDTRPPPPSHPPPSNSYMNDVDPDDYTPPGGHTRYQSEKPVPVQRHYNPNTNNVTFATDEVDLDQDLPAEPARRVMTPPAYENDVTSNRENPRLDDVTARVPPPRSDPPHYPSAHQREAPRPVSQHPDMAAAHPGLQMAYQAPSKARPVLTDTEV